MFAASPVLDMAVMYSATWRNTYWKHLHVMARRPDGRIRIVLPDPSGDSALIETYAATIQAIPDDLRARIKSAITDFCSIEPQRHVEIYLTGKLFRHAVYMFADCAVVALYALCGERIPTPALSINNGDMLSFLKVDFDRLVEQSNRIH